MTRMYEADLGTQWVGAYVYFIANDPHVSVSDPKIIQAMCTTHNVIFSKHHFTGDYLRRFLGSTIILSETNEHWKKRRASIAPAFYKGKLVGLVELAKSIVTETLTRWKSMTKDGRAKIEFMDEIAMTHVKIMLKTAFGQDISDRTIEYEENGKIVKTTIANALMATFQNCIKRMGTPHCIFFPFLADCYLTPGEQAIRRNCERLQNFMFKFVQKRRAEYTSDKTPRFDLLSILIEDENFHHDDRTIIDECLTMFFAGSQTSSVAIQNLILMMIKHPEIKKKIHDELDAKIV